MNLELGEIGLILSAVGVLVVIAIETVRGERGTSGTDDERE